MKPFTETGTTTGGTGPGTRKAGEGCGWRRSGSRSGLRKGLAGAVDGESPFSRWYLNFWVKWPRDGSVRSTQDGLQRQPGGRTGREERRGSREEGGSRRRR